LREKRGKGIQIKLDAKSIDEKLIEEIMLITSEHHGSTDLKIEIYDRGENISVNLFSRNIKVDPSNELIRELKNIADSAHLITS